VSSPDDTSVKTVYAQGTGDMEPSEDHLPQTAHDAVNDVLVDELAADEETVGMEMEAHKLVIKYF